MSVPGGRALPGSEITAAASAAASAAAFFLTRRRTPASDERPVAASCHHIQGIPVALNLIELTLNRNIG